MPVVVQPVLFPLDEALSARLQRLEPSCSVSPVTDQDWYVGYFNQRPIAAACVHGSVSSRQIRQLSLHPANRGRGVGRQLLEQIRVLEEAAGRHLVDVNLSQWDEEQP